jgi:hypothetical protein
MEILRMKAMISKSEALLHKLDRLDAKGLRIVERVGQPPS